MTKARDLFKTAEHEDVEGMDRKVEEEGREGIIRQVYGDDHKIKKDIFTKKRVVGKTSDLSGFKTMEAPSSNSNVDMKEATSPSIEKVARSLFKHSKKHKKIGDRIVNVPCPNGMKGKEYSCGKRGDGFVIYTHRATSKNYPTLESIPASVRASIESSG